MANLSAILVFGIAATIFATTQNLLSATVHLFLFLQVTKYITRRSLAENRWCYVISLFNIIGASVITTTVTFGPVLIAYVFLILTSLRLYVLAREAERVESLDWVRRNAANSLLHTLKLPRGGSAASAVKKAPLVEPSAPPSTLKQTRLPRRMLISAVLLTVATLVMSGALFSVIPRLATQNLFQSYGKPQEESNVSAFSENVEFGAFTEIQLDERVALFVQPRDEERPSYIRMRGVALDAFDGKTWRRSSGSHSHSGTYEFHPLFTTKVYPRIHTYRVMQPPGITTFLFGDSFATKMTIPRNFLYQVDRMAHTVSLLEPTSKEFQYEVESMHEDLALRRDPAEMSHPDRPRQQLIPPTRLTARANPYQEDPADDEDASVAAVLSFLGAVGEATRNVYSTTETENGQSPQDIARDPLDPDEASSRSKDNNYRRSQHRRIRYDYRPLSGEELLQSYLHRCLEVPANLSTGRVPQLAETWTADENTTFAKAMAIETRLRNQFGYSLTPKARGNYIESFLFDVQEGHCEYFATSMAVLLRNLGIPARVVNGFYSTEWNALSGNFTVRQKDAHSWVEAWMGNDYGWMTFDPTPPSGVGRRGDRSALIEAMARLSDAMRMRWYRYVIDYSFSDQENMLREVSRWRQALLGAMKRVNIAGVTSDSAKTIEHDGLSGIIDWRPIAVAVLVMGALVSWQALYWMRRRRRQHYSPVLYYDQLLTLLARRGMAMQAGETPMEFAERVTRAYPQWAAFANLTSSYYKVRFEEPGIYENKVRWWQRRQTHKHPKELSDAERKTYAELLTAITQKNRSRGNQAGSGTPEL